MCGCKYDNNSKAERIKQRQAQMSSAQRQANARLRNSNKNLRAVKVINK